ncbi:MAG: methyl-accepting chemotaxis protein [Acidimicrobiales bacterium]
MSAFADQDSSERIGDGLRWVLSVSAVMVAGFLLSLFLRQVGSYSTPLDGWAVSFFELGVSAIGLARYFDPRWKGGSSVGRLFPLLLGGAGLFWGAGDIAVTVQAAGGGSVPVPSAADAFYVCFFPLCYLALASLLRRETAKAAGMAWLDRIIAGLGIASLFAAFIVRPVLHAVGGLSLSSATSMAYPTGDLVLLCVAVSGIAAVPAGRRRALVLIATAVAVNAIGDTYNLLQASSRMGYVANAVAWPISLLLLAVAARVHPARSMDQRGSAAGGLALSGAGAGAGMVILMCASVTTVGGGAVGLATATLLVAGVRLSLTIRSTQAENVRRQRATEERQSVLLGLLTEVAHSADLLAGASERLTATAGDLSAGAQEASSQADAVAGASDQISTSSRSVTGGAEEMASAVGEIARNAGEALTVGVEAKRESDETNSTIARLAESSAQIGQIIELITGIAEQTNLLALNATIEAARAGSAGKGFAVVAAEVKELATETAKATDRVATSIKAIQRDTEHSVEAIQRISQTIGRINEIQATIAAAVERQSATTSAVTHGLSEVSDNSGQISRHISVAAEAARRTAGGAGEALAAASDLAAMAASLKNLVAEHQDLVPVEELPGTAPVPAPVPARVPAGVGAAW